MSGDKAAAMEWFLIMNNGLLKYYNTHNPLLSLSQGFPTEAKFKAQYLSLFYALWILVCFSHPDLLLHLISLLTCSKFADRGLRSDESTRLHSKPKQTFSTWKKPRQHRRFRPRALACTTPQHAIKLEISRSRLCFPGRR